MEAELHQGDCGNLQANWTTHYGNRYYMGILPQTQQLLYHHMLFHPVASIYRRKVKVGKMSVIWLRLHGVISHSYALAKWLNTFCHPRLYIRRCCMGNVS